MIPNLVVEPSAAADDTGAQRPARGTHRLWGGRFATGPAPELDALNRSIGTDLRLWPFDIRLSKAWAVALWHAGVLTLEESTRLSVGSRGRLSAWQPGSLRWRQTKTCTR